MAKPEIYGICFRGSAQFIHETFIGEGILYSQRRSEWAGEEQRSHSVGEGAFTTDRSSTVARTFDAAREVGWHRVALVPKFTRWRFSRAWFQRLWLITEQHAADDVSRAVIARSVSEGRYP